jgi:hypothetical protein
MYFVFRMVVTISHSLGNRLYRPYPRKDSVERALGRVAPIWMDGHSASRSGRLVKVIRNAAALSLFFISLVASGQTALVATGTVQDSTGAVIPGAQISLQSSRGSIAAHGVTDGIGLFRLAVPSPGQYILDVAEPGFREAKQSVAIRAEGQPALRISLVVEGKNETVNVGDDGSSSHVSTEIERNQGANVVDQNALDRLPVFDANYLSTLARFLDPDAVGTSGMTLIVNGVAANGPGVTASAISSVKIDNNPYSALYARPGRARIELTTEPGTTNCHGSATFLYRDSLFDATEPFAIVKPGEQRTYLEGSLTGPVSRSKKTTFLLSLQNDHDDQEAIVKAALPTMLVEENVPNPTRHYFISGRVFHDYGQANELWAGYSFEHETVANAGVGGTVLPEAGTNTLFYEHEINVQDTYVISPHLVNLGHFLVGHFHNQTSDIQEAPEINVSGSFVGGSAQADLLETEYHFDGTDIVTYANGKNELKFGIDIPDISRRAYDDFTNRDGAYSFASVSDYAARVPFSYLVQNGQGHVPFLEMTFAGILQDTIRVSPKLSIAAGVRYYWQNYFHEVKHDIAPRLDVAYAPWQKGKTVLRGGAGIFFDRTGPTPISDLLHFNGNTLRRFLVLNPSYPVTTAEINDTPTSVVTLDPRAIIPYTVQYGFGVEQQVTKDSSLTLNYVGSRRIDMFRSIDANAPLAPLFASRPNPTLGQDRLIQSEGYQKSNSLQIGFQGRPVSFFTGQAQYTLGKTYNNTSGIASFPAASYDPNADWGRSDKDQRNKFDLLGTFSAQHWFDFGVAFSAYSGMPVNITTGSDDNNDGMALDRPAGVPRNSMHGPAYLDLDLNLSHDFPFTKTKEGPVGTLSINSFNVLNHENDTTYVGVISSPFFGQPVSALPPRRMQLNLSIKF